MAQEFSSGSEEVDKEIVDGPPIFRNSDGSSLKEGVKVRSFQIEMLVRNIWESTEDENSISIKKESLLIDAVICLEFDADGELMGDNLSSNTKILQALFLNRFKFCYVVIQAADHYSVLIFINDNEPDGGSRFSPTSRIFHIDPLGNHLSLNFGKVFLRLCCVAFLNVQYKRTKHIGRDKAPKEPLGVDETCWSEKSVGFTRTSGKIVANRTEKQDGQDAFRYTSIKVPKQEGGVDCGIFAIAYVKVFLSLAHPDSKDEWEAFKKLPQQSDIGRLRSEYFRMNLQINYVYASKKSIKTDVKDWVATNEYMKANNIKCNEESSLLTAIKAASSKALAKETEESLKAKVLDILIKRLQARFHIQPLQELKANQLAPYPHGFFSVALLATVLLKYGIVLCVVKVNQQRQLQRTYFPFASVCLPSKVVVVGLVHNPRTRCFHTISADTSSSDPFGISENARKGGFFDELECCPTKRSFATTFVQESLSVLLSAISAHLELANVEFEFPKLKLRSSIFSDILLKSAAITDESSSSNEVSASMSEHSSSTTMEVATVHDASSSSTAIIDQSSHSKVEVTAMSVHSSSTRKFATVRDDSSSSTMEVAPILHATSVSEMAKRFSAVTGFRLGHRFESIFPEEKRLVHVNPNTGEVTVTQTLPMQPGHGNSASFASETAVVFQPNNNAATLEQLILNVFTQKIYNAHVSSDQKLFDQVNIVCDLLVVVLEWKKPLTYWNELVSQIGELITAANLNDQSALQRWFALGKIMLEINKAIIVSFKSDGSVRLTDRQINIMTVVNWKMKPEMLEMIRDQYLKLDPAEIAKIAVLASGAWTKTLLNKRVDLHSAQFVAQVKKQLEKLAKGQAGTSSSAMKDMEHEAQKNADVGGESSLRRSLRDGTTTDFYVAPATASKPETNEKEIKGKRKNKGKGKGKKKAKTSDTVVDDSTVDEDDDRSVEANDETIKLFAGFDTICDKIVDMPMSETCLENLIRKLSKKLQQMKQKPPRRPRDNAAIVDHPDLVVKASTIENREAGDGLFFCPKEGRPKKLPKSTIIARYGGLQMTKGKLDACIAAKVLLDERSVLLEDRPIAASEVDWDESDSSQTLTKNALLLQGFPFAGLAVKANSPSGTGMRANAILCTKLIKNSYIAWIEAKRTIEESEEILVEYRFDPQGSRSKNKRSKKNATSTTVTLAAEYIRKGYVVLKSDPAWASQCGAVFKAIDDAQLFKNARDVNKLFKARDGVLDDKRFVVHENVLQKTKGVGDQFQTLFAAVAALNAKLKPVIENTLNIKLGTDFYQTSFLHSLHGVEPQAPHCDHRYDDVHYQASCTAFVALEDNTLFRFVEGSHNYLGIDELLEQNQKRSALKEEIVRVMKNDVVICHPKTFHSGWLCEADSNTRLTLFMGCAKSYKNDTLILNPEVVNCWEASTESKQYSATVEAAAAAADVPRTSSSAVVVARKVSVQYYDSDEENGISPAAATADLSSNTDDVAALKTREATISSAMVASPPRNNCEEAASSASPPRKRSRKEKRYVPQKKGNINKEPTLAQLCYTDVNEIAGSPSKADNIVFYGNSATTPPLIFGSQIQSAALSLSDGNSAAGALADGSASIPQLNELPTTKKHQFSLKANQSL